MPVTTTRAKDALLLLLGAGAVLYVGRPILVPLAYGLLTAMVLYPLTSRLERRGLPRALAITIGLVLIILLFSAIASLLLWELNAFLKELPRLDERTHGGLGKLEHWSRELFGLQKDRPQGDLSEQLGRITGGSGGLFIRAANALSGMVFDLFIIPVFAALLLHDRGVFVRALTAAIQPPLQERLPAILHRSVRNFASFITGLVKVYAVVGLLNAGGLYALGVPNALLFGLLTALMTIIPYVGIILSSLLPMAVAWMASGSIWSPIGVVAVFTVVQYLEANLIFPKLVGARLGMNTLASIVIVLVGALLWGVAGMILFIPYVSILMVIVQDMPQWRPFVALLGRGSGGAAA